MERSTTNAAEEIAGDVETCRSDDVETTPTRVTQSDDCYLLHLPFELQSKIFKYASTYHNRIKPIVHMRKNLFLIAPTSLSEKVIPEEALTGVNLAATCSITSKLIKYEQSFYKNNEFEFESAQGMFHYLYALTDERRNSIERIRFPYGSLGNHSSEPGPGMLILQYCSGLREITFDIDDLFHRCVIIMNEDGDYDLLIHDDDSEPVALLDHPKMSALTQLRGLGFIDFVYETQSASSCMRPDWNFPWIPVTVTEKEHAEENARIVNDIIRNAGRKVNDIVRQPKTDESKAITREHSEELRYGSRIETRSKELVWESSRGVSRKL